MGADRKDVHALLEKVGATKVRHNKHAVWELPNGRRVTVPTTPSDPQTWSKTYSRIQKLADSSQEEIPAETVTKPDVKKKQPRPTKQPKQLKIMLPEESVPPKQDLKAQLKSVLPKIKPKPVDSPPPPKSAPAPKPRPKLDPAMEFQRAMLQSGVRRKSWEK